MHTEANTQAFPFKPITGFRYTSVASNASYSEVFLGGVYNFEGALQVGLRAPIVGTSVSGREALGLRLVACLHLLHCHFLVQPEFELHLHLYRLRDVCRLSSSL